MQNLEAGRSSATKMKVAWVVNTIFPDVARHLHLPAPVHGGWMYDSARNLVASGFCQLSVLTVYPGKSFLNFHINGIDYYLIPHRKGSKSYNQHWQKSLQNARPDLIHLHGTELSHGMDFLRVASTHKCIVSIQGLVSICERNCLAGISTWEIIKHITVRDIIRNNSLFQAKRDFGKRGITEREYIRKATAIIGRTDWDQAHTRAINSDAHYHTCNESLRDEFYSGELWDIHNCKRHTLFISQAGYPLKGLHQLIKAASILKKKYPDIHIRVAGSNILKSDTFIDRIKMSGYGSYIKTLVQELGMNKHITFTGPLEANDMKKEFLRAHLFVCPSSIENSPNSLGEAQILGLPCIATSSGGIPSIVKDKQSALLYPFDEHEMLAFYVDKVFSSDHLAAQLSINGHIEATYRHDRDRNIRSLINIYRRYC